MAKKTRLRRLQLMEVAMVSDGDNGPAHVVFAKSKQPEKEATPAPEVPTLEAAPVTEPTTEPTGIEKNKESDMTFKIENIPVEFRKGVQDAIDAAAAEAFAKAKTTPASPVAPVQVAEVPSDIQKKLATQAAEINFLKKRVQDSEITAEIAKCRTEYPNVPDVEDIAKALYKLDQEGAPEAAIFRKNLAAMQAQLVLGKAITTVAGKDGDIAKSKNAEAKLEEIAKSKQAANPGMPYSQALTETFRENKKLYSEYSKSQSPVILTDDSDDDGIEDD